MNLSDVKASVGDEASADDVEMTGVARLALLAAGWVAVALAFLGVFLPLLPTTPFLLAAAWAFAKSSRRMRTWLYGHPRFGRFLQDWRDQGAIPLRGKIAAIIGMTVAWVVVYMTVQYQWAPVVVGACLAGVGAYVASRPSPARNGR